MRDYKKLARQLILTRERINEAEKAIDHLLREVEKIDAADCVDWEKAARDYGGARWISVKDKLPDIGQRVLVVGRSGEAMYVGRYYGGNRNGRNYADRINIDNAGYRKFIARMPTPPAPGIEVAE